MCVTVLEQEEQVGDFQVCLFLRQRDHGNKSYGAFEDFIFQSPVSQISYEEMRRQVAEQTGTSPETLVLYKYDQSTYHYELVGNLCPNLRKAPVSLREGDILGYGSAETQDDFQFCNDHFLEHLQKKGRQFREVKEQSR